jgi:hypothetical protein
MNDQYQKLVLIDDKGHEKYGEWLLSGEMLKWKIDNHIYKINSENDLSRQVNIFLKSFGKRVLKRNIHLKACLTCENFIMSGMARDMGRGQRGVCNFYNIGVEVCYLCENYSAIKK